MLLHKTTKRNNKIMIKKEKNGNNNERKYRRRKMKAEIRKRANLINAKLIQKYNKNDKRNNANSISCDYCNSFDTSRDNN